MPIAFVMRESTLSDLDSRPEAGDAALPMDEEEFRAFYDRTARPVWAYLSRLTGDRQLADDLLQEAYYRFLRAAGRYENETHRRNALFCIATNLARDRSRRLRGGHDLPLHEDAASMIAVDHDTAARAEGRTDLRRALARLKPNQVEMLWLAYGQGLSHDEIASALGLTRGSIKSMLFKARRKLARMLRGETADV